MRRTPRSINDQQQSQIDSRYSSNDAGTNTSQPQSPLSPMYTQSGNANYNASTTANSNFNSDDYLYGSATYNPDPWRKFQIPTRPHHAKRRNRLVGLACISAVMYGCSTLYTTSKLTTEGSQMFGRQMTELASLQLKAEGAQQYMLVTPEQLQKVGEKMNPQGSTNTASSAASNNNSKNMSASRSNGSKNAASSSRNTSHNSGSSSSRNGSSNSFTSKNGSSSNKSSSNFRHSSTKQAYANRKFSTPPTAPPTEAATIAAVATTSASTSASETATVESTATAATIVATESTTAAEIVTVATVPPPLHLPPVAIESVIAAITVPPPPQALPVATAPPPLPPQPLQSTASQSLYMLATPAQLSSLFILDEQMSNNEKNHKIIRPRQVPLRREVAPKLTLSKSSSESSSESSSPMLITLTADQLHMIMKAQSIQDSSTTTQGNTQETQMLQPQAVPSLGMHISMNSGNNSMTADEIAEAQSASMGAVYNNTYTAVNTLENNDPDSSLVESASVKNGQTLDESLAAVANVKTVKVGDQEFPLIVIPKDHDLTKLLDGVIVQPHKTSIVPSITDMTGNIPETTSAKTDSIASSASILIQDPAVDTTTTYDATTTSTLDTASASDSSSTASSTTNKTPNYTPQQVLDAINSKSSIESSTGSGTGDSSSITSTISTPSISSLSSTNTTESSSISRSIRERLTNPSSGWSNMSGQVQDQMVIVSTVAFMALMVGALSARRMRSRQFLSTCIENESLEDELAYDTAYTTSGSGGGGYNTFGASAPSPWRGDLEKFDV